MSEYYSESGGFSTEVVRIEVNENVLYSVTDSTGNHLGYFDNECDAEAVAEDSVL
jgi:predicted alpha/beta-fold hydrolase